MELICSLFNFKGLITNFITGTEAESIGKILSKILK